MHEILLVRGGDAARIFELTAVAAEIAERLGEDAQIDIAVPAASADYAALGGAVRRVIAVQPLESGDWSDVLAGDDNLVANAGGKAGRLAGMLGGKVLSAAKKLSAVAGHNMRSTWKLAEELRVTQYDLLVDFEFSAFSIAVGKLAKARKIVGFDPESVPGAVRGGNLTAHDLIRIPPHLGHVGRMRHLCGKCLDYAAANEQHPLNWQMRAYPPPANTPPDYLLLAADAPPPFAEIARQNHPTVVTCAPATHNAETLAALVQHAAVIVGNGLLASLAAATDTPNLFIGNAADAPPRARVVDTPTALAEALKKTQTDAPPPPPAAPATPKSLKLKKD